MLRLLRSETTAAKLMIMFALIGFLIGAALCAYTFYLTSHRQIGDMVLFLVLCPPSLGALALDNAGVLGGIIGWVLISLANAGLYAGIGFALASTRTNSK
jgi:hypothetical protein